MIKNTNNSPSLFSNLSDMLNQSHPLYRLANKIDWGKFETAFQPLYCQDNGRPGKPIRLMCGLLILKHLRNPKESDIGGQRLSCRIGKNGKDCIIKLVIRMG